MAEITSNVEFAHKIQERAPHGGPHGRGEWLELVEAIALAAVAVLTAWSGYQAAKWDAKSAASYAQAAGTNTQAQEQQTLAGQEHLYDITTFGRWIEAHARGERDVTDLFERRFRPEYAVAFAAWMKTDPFHDPKAAAGPSFMPEYRSARIAKARELSEQARHQYLAGISSRETGDEYVRITVVLATVLLLTAISQRFKIHAARVGLVAVAFVMLTVAMYLIVTFPRA